MTDSEKLDLILEKVSKIEKKISSLEKDITDIKADLKQTERVLKNEIRKESALVLDEVERVHDILDRHKEDKTVHTA